MKCLPKLADPLKSQAKAAHFRGGSDATTLGIVERD